MTDHDQARHFWIGSSLRDLRGLPQEGCGATSGLAPLHRAAGATDPAAKPWKGFGGARVMEIVERDRSGSYRAVYTAQFADAIYDCMFKKSKRGIATPKQDIDLIRRRLAEAERDF